eukprot:gene958-1284_t
MPLISIQYLEVDNVVDDVPDGAPEIDADVETADQIAAALVQQAGVSPHADGSARWQPLSAVTSLPNSSVIKAKVVRSK